MRNSSAWQNAHSFHLLVLLIQLAEWSAGLNFIFETKGLHMALV